MPTKTRGKPGRQDATHRRMQILHAAFGCCTRKGLAAMTMDDVAQAARLSKGLPFYYFQSKSKLFLAMLDLFTAHAVDRTSAILESETSESRRLHDLCAVFVHTLTVDCTHPEMLIEFWALALRDRDVAERLAGVRSHMRSALRETVRRGIQVGIFTCDDVDLAAESLYAALIGIASQWVLGERANPGPLIEAAVSCALSKPKPGSDGGGDA